MASTPGIRNRIELKGTVGWLNSSMAHRERQFKYPLSATVGLQLFPGMCSWEYRAASTCPDLCGQAVGLIGSNQNFQSTSAFGMRISPCEHHYAGGGSVTHPPRAFIQPSWSCGQGSNPSPSVARESCAFVEAESGL